MAVTAHEEGLLSFGQEKLLVPSRLVWLPSDSSHDEHFWVLFVFPPFSSAIFSN